MKATYSGLMQSKYFNPAFNSAIFDGPIRIYFSQFHESLALKLYFQLQNRLLDIVNRAKETHKQTGKNLLIMLYPSKESFSLSFETTTVPFVLDNLEDDDVIGLNGPFEDNEMDLILAQIEKALVSWKPVSHHPFELGL